MDIKAKIDEVVAKVTKDAKFKEQFTKDPVKAVESLLGVDLPEDAISKVVDGVKAKLAGDKLGGVLDGVKGILGKK